MKRLLLIFALVSIANAQPFPPDSVWTFGFDDGGDEYFYGLTGEWTDTYYAVRRGSGMLWQGKRFW
ncbi:MAG: hypothetical protein IPP40_08615 [bacterium]|nr:hypothetical protein [bacterium]